MDKKTMELHDDIMYQSLERISEMDIADEKTKMAIDNASKLNEIMVKDHEWKIKDQARLDQQALEDEKFEHQKKLDKKSAEKSEGTDKEDRIFKIVDRVLTILSLVLPMAFYNRMTTRYMAYNERGHIISFMPFKNFMSKLSWRK